jgi:plasmanylethanolamine desaturase
MQRPSPTSSGPVEREHKVGGPKLFWFEFLSVVLAVGFIIAHLVMLSQHRLAWNAWMLLAIVIAWPAADFASGFVHWLADTWGTEKFPFLGPRFIKPFRVHHETPTSFLKCTFFDTNGDTCLIALPVLCSLWWLPTGTEWGLTILTFGVFFCAFAIPTNQIHQWAHMADPPQWVQILQRMGLILSHDKHSLHHSEPYDGYYCITTGFCNRWLERLKFFRHLEKMITSLTGITPRLEEQRRRHEGRTINLQREP